MYLLQELAFVGLYALYVGSGSAFYFGRIGRGLIVCNDYVLTRQSAIYISHSYVESIHWTSLLNSRTNFVIRSCLNSYRTYSLVYIGSISGT